MKYLEDSIRERNAAYDAGKAAAAAEIERLRERVAELEASNRACVDAVAEWGAKAGALQAEVDSLKQHVKSQMDMNGKLIGITNKHSALARNAEADKDGIRDAIAILTDENEVLCKTICDTAEALSVNADNEEILLAIHRITEERDEAREAVKRLAGALESVGDGEVLGGDCTLYDEALADTVVKRIVEGG